MNMDDSDGGLGMDQDIDDANMSRNNLTPTDLNNLIINYLPDTMTQMDLQKMFESFGEIESCKLIKDKASGHSLGYGFVKFMRHDHAKSAINNLDGLLLQHKKIKVSFARPANEPIKTANVYVSGLKNSITEAELISSFSSFGKVLTVKVMNNTGDTRKANAIGFVRFEQHQCAQRAIEMLDQTRPFDNPSAIHVSFAKQSGKESSTFDLSTSVVNVPHPNYGILNKQLMQFPMSRPGKTASFTGKNLRFDPLGKNSVRGNISEGMYPVNEGLYPVSDGLYTQEATGGFVIFVFNLVPDVEEVQLWRLFGPFGAITDIKIVYDKDTKKSKGFAFVTMTYYREAEAAILALNHTTFEGKVLQVSFKKEKKKLF